MAKPTTPQAGQDAGHVTDADILTALGLDENLKPLDANAPQPAQVKAKAETRAGANGAKAKEQQEEEEQEDPDTEEDPDADPDADPDLEDPDADPDADPDLEDPDTDPDADPDLEDPDTDPDADPDPDEEEKEDPEKDTDEEEELPKGVKSLQKRVNKLTGQKKDLILENTGLKEKLTSATTPILQPTESNPLADVKTEAEVQQRVTTYKAVKRWCLENIEGGEMVRKNPQTGEDETVEIDAKTVRKRLALAEEIISEHAPKRVEFIKAERACEIEAKKVYPQLFDPKAQESEIYSNFIQQCPEILQVPNHRLIIGDSIRGMLVRVAEAKKATVTKKGEKTTPETEKKKVKKLAPRAITPSASAPTTAKAGKVSQAREQFQKTGSQKDLTALIMSGGI